MSGPNFNDTDKPPLAAQNVVYFTKAADLPAPSAGVIALAENTTYVMYNDDPSTSQKQITLTDRIAIPDAGGCRITSAGLATCLLVYTGTGTLFTTSSTFTGFLHIDDIFISCPNGTVFDIDGVLPIGSEFFPRIFLSWMGVFDTDTLGTIKTISVNMNVGAFFGCKQGLLLDHIEEALIGSWRFLDWQNDVGAVMLTVKNNLRFPQIDSCTFETASNETAFDIQPSIGDETFIVTGNSYRGAGTVYAVGTSGSITNTTDASTVGTITAASGTAAGEVVFTDTAHGLSLNQVITTSGFADSNYNGTFTVLAVVDANNFRVHAQFTATGTGSWTSDVVEFTSAAHGIANDDGVQIVNTTDYDAGYVAFNVATNTFQINAVFVSHQGGNWNTDSLTQTDPRMSVIGNAGLSDSKSIGGVFVNGNSTVTVIALADTYQAIDMSSATVVPSIERFTLVDTVAGTLRYDGLEDFDGTINAAISASKAGSTERYDFAISVNGGAPTGFAAPIEIKTTIDTAMFLGSATLVTNDTIQIFARAVGHSDNLTISDMVLTVS